MTILEMYLEKLFDKNEEIVRLVYWPPPPPTGGYSHFLPRWVCDAEQAMVFIFKVLGLKQGIQFH